MLQDWGLGVWWVLSKNCSNDSNSVVRGYSGRDYPFEDLNDEDDGPHSQAVQEALESISPTLDTHSSSTLRVPRTGPRPRGHRGRSVL